MTFPRKPHIWVIFLLIAFAIKRLRNYSHQTQLPFVPKMLMKFTTTCSNGGKLSLKIQPIGVDFKKTNNTLAK